MDSTPAWTWTTPHWQLNVVPGAAVFVGGLILLAGRRAAAVLGGWLALAGGAWFVLGPLFASTWLTDAQTRVASGRLLDTTQPLGYHYGLGLVICVLAAWTIGRRVLVRPIGDYAPATAGTTTAVTGHRRGRFRGRRAAAPVTPADSEATPTQTTSV